MDVDARLDALQSENERLRARLDDLERLSGHRFFAPLEWGLTSAESRVFGAILVREVATKNALMAALYRDDGREEPDSKIIDVFVCKMRKKLKPFGIEIQTAWGQGYLLSRETKSLIKQFMHAGQADVSSSREVA